MAKVHAGVAPWGKGYQRIGEKTAARKGLEWSLSSGWRRKPEDDWDKTPKKPKMRSIRSYTGRTYQVPDDDYQDFISFHDSGGKDIDSDQKLATYIDDASWDDECPGKGHIAYLEYASKRQLLRVEFTNQGGICVFMQVPAGVYSELKYLAAGDGGMTDSKGVFRHAIGLRFWDIVRIRRTVHGTRYDFRYTQRNENIGSGFADDLAVDKATVREQNTGYDQKKVNAVYRKLPSSEQIKFVRMSDEDQMKYIKEHNL